MSRKMMLTPLGQKVLDECKRAGTTIRILAQSVDLSPTYFVHYFSANGKRKFNLKAFEQLEKAFALKNHDISHLKGDFWLQLECIGIYDMPINKARLLIKLALADLNQCQIELIHKFLDENGIGRKNRAVPATRKTKMSN